ncbi:hypothetical protein HYC85_003518 [Camellia sinensis]|uniref:Uncharacterized protein n=1 Tax=Camellia sinensis TaxID=4442 RepID=A0A7J7HTX5_CAMSI|nr:hypothetical protein HYC85_003518 [Camellia sinensis]
MRIRLLSASTESEILMNRWWRNLGENYKNDLGTGFNAQQLAIVAGLCEWRDVVARVEDENNQNEGEVSAARSFGGWCGRIAKEEKAVCVRALRVVEEVREATGVSE